MFPYSFAKKSKVIQDRYGQIFYSKYSVVCENIRYERKTSFNFFILTILHQLCPSDKGKRAQCLMLHLRLIISLEQIQEGRYNNGNLSQIQSVHLSEKHSNPNNPLEGRQVVLAPQLFPELLDIAKTIVLSLELKCFSPDFVINNLNF